MVIPKGFFPKKTSARSRSPPRPVKTPRLPKWCAAGACRRDHPRRPGGGGAQLVQRRRRRAKHRAHVHHAETARRAPADEAGGGGPAQASCASARHQSSCGRCRTCSSAAARARRSTSTSCKACAPTSSTTGPPSCRSELRADPMFRDVTSDAQLRGLQAQLKIDRDRANALGVSIEAVRRRCSAPSANARCRPSTCPPTATR
jgi:hypothetical protein